MAGVDMGKRDARSSESLPTPQRRRAATPEPTPSQKSARHAAGPSSASADPRVAAGRADAPVGGGLATDRSVAPAAGQVHAPQHQQQQQQQIQRDKKATWISILLILAGLSVPVLVKESPKDAISTAVNQTAGISDSPVQSGPSMLDRVAAALSCAAPRADIMDILSGAPYEFFRRDVVEDASSQPPGLLASFEKFPQLVQRVAKERDQIGATRAETELQETVLQLAATGGGWPTALQQRILTALDSPCQVNCSAPVAGVPGVTLTVDEDATSAGTVSQTSGWFHQTLLSMGAKTGLSVFRNRANQYKSRPASVVVSPKPVSPRDCLAFRGNASLALRVAGASSAAAINHIVIEQLAHSHIASKLQSLPGQFDVWGEPAKATPDQPQSSEPYSLHLGSFTYAAAAPAQQAFVLKQPTSVSGLKIKFQTSSTSYFCVYRVRAFETSAPSCIKAAGTTGRLAAAVK